ncbi:MAG TPA: Uma2 family endonuclease [Thermoanaerobaculia bacterium]|nr:Uma2 family endonuclease [Thermoanaerobaculia bacterium]
MGHLFRIPATARDLEGFRRWARSPRFPDRGRIDYVGGDLEVDMGPEDLQHGVVKLGIGARLHLRIGRTDLGDVYLGRARISSPVAALSVEPDIVVILYDSLDTGRVREIPRRGDPESIIELEGAADLVVEVISDGSVRKDRTRLPPKYAAAGVPELWLVDVRRGLRFDLHVLGPDGYRLLAPDADGWLRSPLIGPVRLRRERKRPDRWSYRLDVGED